MCAGLEQGHERNSPSGQREVLRGRGAIPRGTNGQTFITEVSTLQRVLSSWPMAILAPRLLRLGSRYEAYRFRAVERNEDERYEHNAALDGSSGGPGSSLASGTPLALDGMPHPSAKATAQVGSLQDKTDDRNVSEVRVEELSLQGAGAPPGVAPVRGHINANVRCSSRGTSAHSSAPSCPLL